MTAMVQSNLMGAWVHGDKKHQYAHGAGLVQHEFGKWVDTLANWSWFVTRTFARNFDAGFSQVGAGSARVALRDLVVWSECKEFVGVFERHESGDFHIHAVLAGCKGISAGVAKERDKNKFGFSAWKRYSEGGGATGYLGKYLAKDMSELYVGLKGPYSKEDLMTRVVLREGTVLRNEPTMGGLRVECRMEVVKMRWKLGSRIRVTLDI